MLQSRRKKPSFCWQAPGLLPGRGESGYSASRFAGYRPDGMVVEVRGTISADAVHPRGTARAGIFALADSARPWHCPLSIAYDQAGPIASHGCGRSSRVRLGTDSGEHLAALDLLAGRASPAAAGLTAIRAGSSHYQSARALNLEAAGRKPGGGKVGRLHCDRGCPTLVRLRPNGFWSARRLMYCERMWVERRCTVQ